MTHPARLFPSILLLLAGCWGDSGYPPCGAGLGRADDGECYPLADTAGDTDTDTDSDSDTDTDADSDTDTDTDSDTDSDTDADTDTGPPPNDKITVSGTFTFLGTLTASSQCAISAWNAEAVLGDGTLDHAYTPLSVYPLPCPSGGTGAYSATLSIGADPLALAIYGFIDLDGSPDTPTDTRETGSPANPLNAEPGGIYTGVDLTLEAP